MLMKNLLTKSVLISLLSGAMIFGFEKQLGLKFPPPPQEISNYDSARDKEGVFEMKKASDLRLGIESSFFDNRVFKFLLQYPIFFRMLGIEGLKVLRVSDKVVALIGYTMGKYNEALVNINEAIVKINIEYST